MTDGGTHHRYDHSCCCDLNQGLAERNAHELFADDGDTDELDRHDTVGNQQGQVDILNDERKSMADSTDHGRQSGDQATSDGTATAGLISSKRLVPKRWFSVARALAGFFRLFRVLPGAFSGKPGSYDFSAWRSSHFSALGRFQYG